MKKILRNCFYTFDSVYGFFFGMVVATLLKLQHVIIPSQEIFPNWYLAINGNALVVVLMALTLFMSPFDLRGRMRFVWLVFGMPIVMEMLFKEFMSSQPPEAILSALFNGFFGISIVIALLFCVEAYFRRVEFIEFCESEKINTAEFL